MKNLKNIFTALLLAATFTFASATNNPVGIYNVSVTEVANAKKLDMIVANALTKVTTIEIIDEEYVNVYADKINAAPTGTVRRFDVSALPEGAYSLRISNEDKLTVYNFEIIDDHTELVGEKIEIFTPQFLINDAAVTFNMMTTGMENISVSILDSYGELVHFETVKREEMLTRRRYNVAALPAGDYSIVVSTDYETFYKDFVKE